MIDCTPHIHLAAYHASSDYNNHTSGLGVICAGPRENVRIVAGGYYNSLRRDSYYAGFVYQPMTFGTLRLGAMGGLVSGYQTRVVPMAAAVASLPIGKTEWHLTLVPPAYESSPAVAELSVSFKF